MRALTSLLAESKMLSAKGSALSTDKAILHDHIHGRLGGEILVVYQAEEVELPRLGALKLSVEAMVRGGRG